MARIAVALVAVNVLVCAVPIVILGGVDEEGGRQGRLYFWPIRVANVVGGPFVIEAVHRRKRG